MGINVAHLSSLDKLILVAQYLDMKKPVGPGRPAFAKGKAKSDFIIVKVTPAEKAAIEAQSDNPSEWARNRLLQGIKPS